MQSFRVIKPTAALVPYVRHYWVLSDDALAPVSERTLPVGCVQMVFHRGRQLFSLTEGRLQPSSFISGQAFGYSDVESTGMLEMIVVVFQPFAAKAFLHMPVSEFRGMNVNTEETGDPLLVDLGRRIADMPDRVACIRLIEEFLLSRLYAFPEYNLKRVSTVLEAVNLHPHIRTAQLADVACLSNKQFGRVCGVCRRYSQGVSAHCADTAGVVYSTMPAGHFVCATGLRMWFLRPIAHD